MERTVGRHFPRSMRFMVPFQVLVVPLHRGQSLRLGEFVPWPARPRRVDGASEFRIFLRVALPLLLPALASLAIIVFIWSWGAFLWPLVIVQDKALNVLSVGLTSYTQPYNGQPMWAAAMAASTVATIPIAALFIFFQRYFVQGLTAGAVKG